MNDVYLSFLGLGGKNKTYERTRYVLNGQKSSETEYVQLAEIELLGADKFDKLVIVATAASEEKHFNKLQAGFEALGVKNIHRVIIPEDISSAVQWQWFESVLGYIDTGNRLTVDMTHGYRMISIVFSAAIDFLQQARKVELEAVYYGAFEMARDKGYAPIVDMKDFYRINQWADAVSRLVEEADARKLAEVASNTRDFQVGELNDPTLIRAFEELTETVRNVDINNVAKRANAAIGLIQEKKKGASPTGKILLDLVVDKFATLTTRDPPGGRYDREYFRLQLEIIRLLLAHRLFMQAYTVMREFIGSIGMLGVEGARVDKKKGRKDRRWYADVFIVMVCIEQKDWNFGSENEKNKLTLLPFYDRLQALGIIERLRTFSKDLTRYRNGFDHAWTAQARAYGDIEKKGGKFLKKLSEIINMMGENGIL
jgi:hypothetical protein